MRAVGSKDKKTERSEGTKEGTPMLREERRYGLPTISWIHFYIKRTPWHWRRSSKDVIPYCFEYTPSALKDRYLRKRRCTNHVPSGFEKTLERITKANVLKADKERFVICGEKHNAEAKNNNI